MKGKINVIQLMIISTKVHACSGKNEVVKQLWWLDYQLCFTLLGKSKEINNSQEVWSKVDSLAIKVASQLCFCLNMRVIKILDSFKQHNESQQ